MTDIPGAIVSTASIGDQIEALTRQATSPLDVHDDLYVAVDRDGRLSIADLNPFREMYADRPRRKIRVQQVHDPEAFIAYMAKNSLPESEVWSDVFGLNVTGVIDAGQAAADGNGGGRAEHRVVFTARATPAWLAWKDGDGTWQSQEEMAEKFEDRLPDFVDPDGATMLELAQTFQASRSGAFESSQRLATGETALVYRDDVAATAGKGRLQIPDTFTLALQPIEGSRIYKVTCRFRYRIRDQRLRLSYKIDRPEEIVRTAFDDVTESIGTGVAADVWSGSAP